jgi:uncharacterized membrane protein YeaQ/YmgE (transglycosylase-associated protein family)
MPVIGALITGFIAGVIARIITPGDYFRHMSGPVSWFVSLLIGLGGALIGYLIFHVLLGWGNDRIFNIGGIVGAIIGAVILLVILGFIMRRRTGKATA